MTLRLYAAKRGWALDSVEIHLSHERVHARDCAECDENDNVMVDLIRLRITIAGALDDEQQERLLTIAKRCPVHRTLDGGPTIITELEVVGG